MPAASAWARAASALPSWRAMGRRSASRWSSRASSRCRRPKRCFHSFELIRRRGGTRAARIASAEQLLDLRDDLKEIAHQAEIGNLEDRRLAVLVDRDDGACVLDAGEVLDRTGDSDR